MGRSRFFCKNGGEWGAKLLFINKQSMNFASIMFFTKKYFHLECLFFSWLLFDTWDCYYFWSNLSLVSHINVLHIKNYVTLFCSLLNKKKWLCHMVLSWFILSLGLSCQKIFPKVRLLKEIKRGGWLYRGGIVYRSGLNFLDAITMFYAYNINYEWWLLCF